LSACLLLVRSRCQSFPGSLCNCTFPFKPQVQKTRGQIRSDQSAKLTAVALANKLARIIYALATKGGHYDDRPVAA
jgi:hypothetical protein